MQVNWRKKLVSFGLCVATFPLLSGCGATEEKTEIPPSLVKPGWMGETVNIADNEGTKDVPLNPKKVVAWDERARDLLEALGVEAADDVEQADLIVIATEQSEQLPDVPVVDVTPREGPPLDWEMVRQVQILGPVFEKDEEAKTLDDEFSGALVRAKDEADEDWTVAIVGADGTDVDTQAGRGFFEPVVKMLGLELVEAEKKPDVILVVEPNFDPAVEGYTPAMKLVLDDERFEDSDAVEDANIYVAPFDTPEVASIAAYTQVFNELAGIWEAMN